jgi:hypothetical protein
MGGMSYPMDTNNQNYQKYLAEEVKSVAVDISIVLDKLEMLINDMVAECDCEDGCCR